MKEIIDNRLQSRLYGWLTRRTINSGVRRVGELPLAIGSDIGTVRKENQDRVAVLRMQLSEDHSFTVVALCDGMGGMAEGSSCASQAIASFFMACIRNQHVHPKARLVLAAQDANQAVHALYKGRGGATLSAVLLDSIDGMSGLNVGDSRIYAYQENKLEQITVDDTMAGLLKNELLQRNELIQFIGMGDGLEPHVIEIPSSHEAIVLTSDGVHFIDKQVMLMVIKSAKDSAVAVRRLIEIAKWCGGHDNSSTAIINPLPKQLKLLNYLGIIQVWDPFGELEVIVSESGNIGIINNKRQSVPKSPLVQGGQQRPKRPAKAKKEKQVKRKTDLESEIERPLLNIYFKNDTDKDRHD